MSEIRSFIVSKKQELYDQLLNSIEEEINQGIDKIQFTEEQVENSRNICLLYYEHVRGHSNAAYDPSSDNGDLKKGANVGLHLKPRPRAKYCSLAFFLRKQSQCLD